MGDYDQTRFMAPECQNLYYDDLSKINLLLQRGICLDKVLGKIPVFHERLVATWCRFFTLVPYRPNEHLVREFYANLRVMSLSKQFVRIQETNVHFGEKLINDLYRLLYEDMEQFEAKGYESGCWLVEKLYPSREISWYSTKMGISLPDFTDEARIWLAINCSQNYTKELGLRSTPRINGCTQRPIYPLKIWGEGAPGKSKKRKINLGKSIDEDRGPCGTSIIGLFKKILVEMGVIKELVDGLPQGPAESSTTNHSYFSQYNYEKYLNDQKKHEATISRLERAYSSLAHSHRELKDSHEKMKKGEKKRDKFFTKI
ncbi:hypothetical protein FXO37_15941 [Capsicum annuum]|nr:hypothetical protein FXO37_15941 [Capsicum annuum]